MFEFFEIAPKKDAQGDAVYILSALKVFLFFQLSVEGWVFMSADFWIVESNDNINTFLTSY